ncbi:MAG: aminotransferase class I/II-fold pyridoxal phosphate-dependent enzyme [Bacillota bacterium]|nr:MAG: aminotransferase class I/II-fold pyridoxal phosphate-dependent enzyme [Bacillota bacterium]
MAAVPNRESGRNKELSLADFYVLDDPDLLAKARAFYDFTRAQKKVGHYVARRTLLTASQNRVVIMDPYTEKPREMVMMASNNYLGLTTHPKVIQAGIEAYEKWGAGAGSVSLLAGTFELHRKLELKLAAFKGSEDAVIFPAGYSTNVGIISGIARPGDLVLNDILNHASIVDGSRLSGADVKTFPHKSVKGLDQALRRLGPRYNGKLVVVDGVYSMDGDIAPVPEMLEVCRNHGARLMIDEAHATGVIGKRGHGTPEHFGIPGQVDIVMGTLSKGLGGVGGFACAAKEVVEYLRFYARAYMFSTALPPATTASLIAALDVIDEEPELVQKLWWNIRYLREELTSYGFDLGESETAIFPIIIGDDWKVKEMTRLLHEDGIFVNAVFYPAVARRLSRIRISLMATHTKEDLDETIAACAKAGKKLGVIK